MWNNLKSDCYRMVHTRAFYISIIIAFFINMILLFSTGLTIGSNFAEFASDKNSFVEYLYYILKSPTYMLVVLVFLSIFHNDEYSKGFVKNTMPIIFNKSKLILERYLFNVLVCIIFWFVMFIAGCIRELTMPLTVNIDFQLFDYFIYACVQILLICSFISLLMVLNHLTRSKVLLIVISCLYSMFIIFMIEASIAQSVFHDMELLKYTMYVQSGVLPYTYSWDGYSLAFTLIIIHTVLYNSISYIILRRKDI